MKSLTLLLIFISVCFSQVGYCTDYNLPLWKCFSIGRQLSLDVEEYLARTQNHQIRGIHINLRTSEGMNSFWVTAEPGDSQHLAKFTSQTARGFDLKITVLYHTSLKAYQADLTLSEGAEPMKIFCRPPDQ